MDLNKPPVGARTRWAGFIPMLRWVNHNRYAICKYDCKHPSDCAALEDGSDYTDHMMETQDWDLLLQMVIALHLFHVVFLPCY